MTEQRHHNRNPKKVMAQEQKKTSKNTNSRRRGSARGRNANGSNSRTPSRKINATRQATAPQQDAVLIAPPKYRKGSMRITPLGGLGEIGRNMNVIEYNGHLLLIDCGVLFPEEEQPGVDLILPDFSYIKNRLDKVDALVLTHGHEDHIGGVPYLLKLRPDLPLSAPSCPSPSWTRAISSSTSCRSTTASPTSSNSARSAKRAWTC